ncbi:FAD-binding oxidoreductase [Halobium salinum]|uniref:FAD-binding oxidoreductase n=1 Tax=Halobium salinum TaxID=1364940 RepID=A0ABD5PFE9_9EURY|nr:FAD-binding oxidoreductase [Halobium salinum]
MPPELDAPDATRPTRRLSDLDLVALRERFRGDVLTPEDPDYHDARALWNGLIDRYPTAVVRPTGTADVVAAVRFARERDLPIAVRGGGHNVAGSALVDDGLCLDLSAMNAVSVDPDARRALVGGGATIGDVDHETQLHGLAAPLGVVSATGVAGLTLNGGLGHVRRRYGLSLDNVRSFEVVTADGEVLTASNDDHEELFWALRGGGGNFGVVTRFEYDLHAVGPEVFGLFVWYHADDARTVLRGVDDWAPEATRDASVLPFLATVPELGEFPESTWGQPAVAVLGCHVGGTAAAEAEFERLRDLAEPVVDLSGPLPYVELQSMLDADYPDGLRYYWKALYVDELTAEVVDLLVRYGRSRPSALSTVDLWHLGGAIDDTPPDGTAFRHRGHPYLVTFEANWEESTDDDANVAWAREGIEELRSLPAVSGAYGNFPGFGEDPVRSLFGRNYDRLARVKAEYDPENVFRSNLNVEPAADDATPAP